MKKFLLIIISFNFFLLSIFNIISCKPEKGNIINIYYLNKNKGNYYSNHNLKGINFYKDEILENEKKYKNLLINYNSSIYKNIIFPLLYGINLTKDNYFSFKGAKWTKKQLEKSLQNNKKNLINNFSEEKNNIWKKFFKNYSNKDDSFFSKVILSWENNENLLDNETGRILVPVSNLDYINNINKIYKKYNDNKINNNFYFNLEENLNVFPHIKKVIDLLNNNFNFFNIQSHDINQNLVLQSIRHILLEIPPVNFIFEFYNKNNNNVFSFVIKVKHITAKLEYMSYKTIDNNVSLFGHQWFFTGYDFYDLSLKENSNYKNDKNHIYNFKDDSKIILSNDVNLSIGFINDNNPFSLLTENQEKLLNNKNKSKFYHNSNFSIPYLDWEIDYNSIYNWFN